jgi:hypothetical protein
LYLFQKTAFEKEATCEFSKPVRLLFNAVRFSKIETQKKEIKSDLLLGGSPDSWKLQPNLWKVGVNYIKLFLLTDNN